MRNWIKFINTTLAGVGIGIYVFNTVSELFAATNTSIIVADYLQQCVVVMDIKIDSLQQFTTEWVVIIVAVVTTEWVVLYCIIIPAAVTTECNVVIIIEFICWNADSCNNNFYNK